MSAFDDLAGLIQNSDGPSPWAVGTVAGFSSNGANPPTVTVLWQGAQVLAECPRHYTPVVGHVVLMARFGPQLNIIGAY